MEKLKELIEERINKIIEGGMPFEKLEELYKLVDIHKDIENEKYWEKRGENMMYREPYGRRRDSQGRYMRRRYKGEEMLNDMQETYNNYAERREEYNRGNYGAKDSSIKSLEYMLQSVVEFIEMLKRDANSQEEVDIISEYASQISEM